MGGFVASHKLKYAKPEKMNACREHERSSRFVDQQKQEECRSDPKQNGHEPDGVIRNGNAREAMRRVFVEVVEWAVDRLDVVIETLTVDQTPDQRHHRSFVVVRRKCGEGIIVRPDSA